jgi:hypothetical protein
MLSALCLKRPRLAGVFVGTLSAAALLSKPWQRIGKVEAEGEGTFGLNEEYPSIGCLSVFQLIGRGISLSTAPTESGSTTRS